MDKLQYLIKCFKMLNSLSKIENLPKFWLYYDYVKSLLIHGCLIRQYVIGEFWKYSYQERKKCLTYRRICKLFLKYNDSNFIHVLNEKKDFNRYFSSFLNRDWLYARDCTKEQLELFLNKHMEFIMKPQDGVEGNGVRKYSFGGLPGEVESLFKILSGKNILLEEIIIQHPQMIFNNVSVNTIRMHTVLDNKGMAHHFKAILRVGIGDSLVDNYCQGGMIYEVDIQTGIVCTHGQGKQNQRCFIHPNTNIIMLGYQIPLWEKVLEISKKAAESLPQVRIIGWDIAITSDGVELIEGNYNPDYELFEFMGSRGYYAQINKIL